MHHSARMAGYLAVALAVWTTDAVPQDKRLLTLEESMTIAFEKNPDLKSAEKELSKARAGVWEAVSAILPGIDANASYQHAWEIQETTIPNFLKPALGPLAPPGMPDYIKIAFGMQNTFTYGATLNQPLFLGGAGWSGIAIARASARAAEQNLEATRQGLIYQTAEAFYACLLAQDLVAVQEKALAQT